MTQARLRRQLLALACAIAAVLIASPAASAGPGDTQPTSSAGTGFYSSFEDGEPAPTWTNTVDGDRSEGVTGPTRDGLPGDVSDKVIAAEANGENEGAGEVAENLFDGSSQTKWLVFERTGWVEAELSEPVAVVHYALVSANDAPGRDPRNWTLSGSNDGTTWTVLDTQTNQDFTERFQSKEYRFANTTAYKHYRLDITANHGDGIVQLAELQLSNGDTAPPPPSDMTSKVGDGPRGGYTAKSGVGFTGVKAFEYAGTHEAEGRGHSYNKVFDVDVPVRSTTELSYLIYPDFVDEDLSYPSTYASVDLVFTDGSSLSDMGARDQHGAILSPRGQQASKTLYTNQWNFKKSRIGAVAAGKTIDRILVAYDNPDGPTEFGGWIDDVKIDDEPAAEAALAAVGLGRDEPRHELDERVLARQQHPGDRRAARVQLLDPGHERGVDELALRLPPRQQRAEPADAGGVRRQPRAEPVDGRAPDVPGDAVQRVGCAWHQPQRPRAAVPALERDDLAAPLRGRVRERDRDRDRADRPRGDVPLQVPGLQLEPRVRQRRRPRRARFADDRPRERRRDRLLGCRQRAVQRRGADVRPRDVRRADDRQRADRRAHRLREVRRRRRQDGDDADRNVVHQPRPGAQEPGARDRADGRLRGPDGARPEAVGRQARRDRGRGRHRGPADDALLEPLPAVPLSELRAREHRHARRPGVAPRGAVHVRPQPRGRAGDRGRQGLRQQRLLGHVPDGVVGLLAARAEDGGRAGRRLRPAVPRRRLDQPLVLARLREPDDRHQLGRLLRRRLRQGHRGLRRA